MGKKTKVEPALVAVVIIGILMPLIHGCVTPSPPPIPTIAVEEYDSASSTSVTISFHGTYKHDGAPPYVELNNVEEVQAYMQEVEFLLSRLEETERRMNIHEPEPIEEVELVE